MIIYSYPTTSRPALGSTQPRVQWVAGALSPKLKRPGLQVNHSPLSCAEANDSGATSPLPSPLLALQPCVSLGQLYGYSGGFVTVSYFRAGSVISMPNTQLGMLGTTLHLAWIAYAPASIALRLI
jgi:hypothetical protein